MAFFAKFKHCLYEKSKELLENKMKEGEGGCFKRKLSLWHYFDVIAFFTCTVRILLITAVMYNEYQVPGWYDFRRQDVIVGFLHTFRTTFDYTTFLMVYFFGVVYFLLEWWCFRLNTSTPNWRFWHQLMVATLEHYRQCRLNESSLKRLQSLKQEKYRQKLEAYWWFVPVPVKKAFARGLASAEIFYKMEDVNLQRMQSGHPLSMMPLLGWSLRARALQVMLLTEVLAFAFQLAIGERESYELTLDELNVTSFFLVMIYATAIAVFISIYPHWRRHYLLSIVEFAYEISWPLVFLLLLVRYVVLFTTMTILGAVVFIGHLREWQCRVRVVIDAHFVKKKRRTLLKPPKIPASGRLLLERLLCEHNLISYLVISCSDQLFGKVVLATICTQIPINIVFVKKIVIGSEQETPLSFKFLLFIIFAIQLGVFAGIFVPLSWCQSQYHSPKSLVHRLMLATTDSGAWWWTLRLKYNDLYGRLVCGPKVAITVGPLHAITYFSSLEFLFTYCAYVLMIFSQEKLVS